MNWKNIITNVAGFIGAAALVAPSFGHVGYVDGNHAIAAVATAVVGWYTGKPSVQ